MKKNCLYACTGVKRTLYINMWLFLTIDARNLVGFCVIGVKEPESEYEFGVKRTFHSKTLKSSFSHGINFRWCSTSVGECKKHFFENLWNYWWRIELVRDRWKKEIEGDWRLFGKGALELFLNFKKKTENFNG